MGKALEQTTDKVLDLKLAHLLELELGLEMEMGLDQESGSQKEKKLE